VHDAERRVQLHRAIDDAIEMSSLAFEMVQTCFEDGRRRMYRLANDVMHLTELLDAIAERPPRIRAGDEEAFQHIVDHFHLFAAEVGDFARAWLAQAAALPVVDGIAADAEEGHVLDASVPMTLLGTLSDADAQHLEEYEQKCAQACELLELLLGRRTAS
jgi:hypothetical protein